MKTYVALAAISVAHRLILQKSEYPNILISYHYDTMSSTNVGGVVARNRKERFVDGLGYTPKNLMLDSGAFSVWSKGGEQSLIDIQGYINWAKWHAERFPMVRVTNLDVIPLSRSGERPSKKWITECVKKSTENADMIRASGLRVLEVFHLSEPIEVWEAIIERRKEGECIGIGGIGKGSGPERRAHGDTAFRKIKEMCGWDAVPPIHGFAAVSSDIAWRYPLSSCDASTWLAPGRWGQQINRNGRLRGGQVQNRKRLYFRDYWVSESAKILDMWQKRDAQIDLYWKQRGVNILSEGPAHAREPVTGS